MRVTRAAEYAVRCVLYLSGQPPGVIINRNDVAMAMEIPAPFLGKIVQQLARAGILEIVQGAKGGLRLARLPSEISLLEVVEAVTGEIFLNDCILRPESCSRSPICPVHRIWDEARTELRRRLQDATFQRLMEEEIRPGARGGSPEERPS